MDVNKYLTVAPRSPSTPLLSLSLVFLHNTQNPSDDLRESPPMCDSPSSAEASFVSALLPNPFLPKESNGGALDRANWAHIPRPRPPHTSTVASMFDHLRPLRQSLRHRSELLVLQDLPLVSLILWLTPAMHRSILIIAPRCRRCSGHQRRVAPPASGSSRSGTSNTPTLVSPRAF
jgi:hypothetical protein